MPEPVRVAVLASGSGSNLQALLDAEARGDTPWRTVLVVSDREGTGALERAARAGVEGRVIPVADRDRDDVAADTLAALKAARVDAILLAGYLRLVPGQVVARYRGRILNIHPALLPAFGGKGMWGRRVHEAVLASGARISGPTVHLVDERYDEGRILAQWPVPVLNGDTAETLAGRVLEREHALYPQVAARLARAIQAGEPVTPLDAPGEIFQAVGHPPEHPPSNPTENPPAS